MTEKTSSKELASLAGRILAAGNPLDNEQVSAAIKNVLDPQHRDFVFDRISALFTPYFENMMTLAGSVLSQADDDDEDEAGEVRVLAATITDPEGLPAYSEFFDSALVTYGTEKLVSASVVDRIGELSTREAVLSLLKGLYPSGTDWGRLSLITNVANLTDLARELKADDMVRQDDATVYASLKTMGDKSITAIPWVSGSGSQSS